MDVLKAFKFRLKLNNEQAQQCIDFAGANRFVWNYFLARNLYRLENKLPICWYQENDFWSKQLKASDEYHFLKKAPAHTIQQTLRDLDRAFKDGFDKNQPLKRIPVFKRKGMKDSFRFPEPKHFELVGNRIKLPKLGWCRFYHSRKVTGEIKSTTVSRHGKHWFISITTSQAIKQPVHQATTSVGVDMGVANTIALSTGELVESVAPFKKHQDKLAKAQRRLAKKKKFSQNWKRQREKITRIHTKIANTRHDFQHKTSTMLSKNHAMIVIEDLQVKNMSRSAKGDLLSPGKQVRQKAGLNRSILDQGWYELRRQLQYKQDWSGGSLVAVPAHHTSQTCPVCGHVDKANRKSQSLFVCTNCGHMAHADVNAAINIEERGHRLLACGELGLPDSMKQEPVSRRETRSLPAAYAA